MKRGEKNNYLECMVDSYMIKKDDWKKAKRVSIFKCTLCGTEKEINVQSVKNGSTKSCGCYNKVAASNRMKDYNSIYTEGITDHPLYQNWIGIKNRCYSPSYSTYDPNYIVCDEWKNNYENFYNWGISKWFDGARLVRIDENKDYLPENCKFVDMSFVVKNNMGDRTEKRKETNLKKYGVEHYVQTEEYLTKKIKTSLEKYGVEHPQQLEEIKEKIKQTNIKRYGFPTTTQNKEV